MTGGGGERQFDEIKWSGPAQEWNGAERSQWNWRAAECRKRKAIKWNKMNLIDWSRNPFIHQKQN